MNKAFFTHNRNKLAVSIGESGIVVLSAHTLLQRTGDAAYPFAQEANFWYLTGIEIQDWLLIMDTGAKKTWLVAPRISRTQAIFDGSLTREEASKISGIEMIIERRHLNDLLKKLAAKSETVYTLGLDPHRNYYDFALNPAQARLNRQLRAHFKTFADCRKLLAAQRAIKQPIEIAAQRRAIDLTSDAFNHIKKQLPSYTFEYEIEAAFSHYFRSRGFSHGYSPIVASGLSAGTLHYDANNNKLPTNSLLLLDIGARVDGYSADISRTYALGQPTDRQRELHGALAEAHKKIISLLRPGLEIVNYVEQVDVIMKVILREIGLLASSHDERYRDFFPHAISHGLGVDVHDSLGGFKEFQPGMVLTVEPGIYISDEGVGLRIEDDILITENGCENLSQTASTALD